MARGKLAAFRALAESRGWLVADAPLPEDAEIAGVIGHARRARSTISTVEAFRDLVNRWLEHGVCGVAIHAALRRCVASTVTPAVTPPCGGCSARSRRAVLPRPPCGCSSPQARRRKLISVP